MHPSNVLNKGRTALVTGTSRGIGPLITAIARDGGIDLLVNNVGGDSLCESNALTIEDNLRATQLGPDSFSSCRTRPTMYTYRLSGRTARHATEQPLPFARAQHARATLGELATPEM